ncbi:MAG: 16S rRNA (adenine(1518)-N(6)/adenine(1519)-N(6))-dimethyltransferase RsmA [Thermodesulfobacteriota bacterium]
MNKGEGPGRKGDYGERAKKRLGQHFLKDRFVIARIIKAAGVSEGEHVVEIGPGPGYLTEGLLGAGAIVTAIELDRDMCGFLREKFSGVEGFNLIQGDALKVDFFELSGQKGEPFKVVSNPPYNITGPLLFRLLEARGLLKGVVLTIQKEVAARIVSGPGSKEYGILSVLLQVHFDVKSCFKISRSQFTPAPKVDSVVVSLTPLERPRVEVEDERFFTTVVKAAFGRRRKTLLNALTSLGAGKAELKVAMESAGVNSGRRAETLSLEEFSTLAGALLKLRGKHH